VGEMGESRAQENAYCGCLILTVGDDNDVEKVRDGSVKMSRGSDRYSGMVRAGRKPELRVRLAAWSCI
jgi:hypothetical protein